MNRVSMVAVLALAVACGDDGGGDGGDTTPLTEGADTSASNTDGVTSTSAGSVSETGSGSATTTASTSSDTTGIDSSGDGSTGGSDSGGALVTCADATCGVGQVCVNPCCGGPAPACTDTLNDGTCPGGAKPVGADECDFPCTSDTCCPPTDCIPDPPFCVDASELTCNGDACDHFECTGFLQDGQLACECA